MYLWTPHQIRPRSLRWRSSNARYRPIDGDDSKEDVYILDSVEELLSIRRPGNLLISVPVRVPCATTKPLFVHVIDKPRAHWSVENISRQGRCFNHLPRTRKYGGPPIRSLAPPIYPNHSTMTIFRGPPTPYIQDDLTIPQFILDSHHPARPVRPHGIPWLIDDATGTKVGFDGVRISSLCSTPLLIHTHV